MLLSIGADHVVDYAKEDFTKTGQVYDLILDAVSHRSVFDYGRAMSLGGISVIIGGSSGKVLPSLLLGSWVLGSRKVRLLLLRPNPRDLAFLNEQFEAGKVVPIIDRIYTFNEVVEAFRYFGEGRVKGKIVIAP
jgi:NADPH:quinone reductase-like Zn-dependent oxidoreductase